MFKTTARFGAMLTLSVFMLAIVACSSEEKAAAPTQAQATAATSPARAQATAVTSPAPNEVETLIQQGKFEEAIQATYAFSVLQEQDAELKKVLDSALEYGDFESALIAAQRIKNLQARDAGLERVFAAALARAEFDVATDAARELPTERRLELLSELVKVATERGELRQAINAAAQLEEQDAQLQKVLDSALEYGDFESALIAAQRIKNLQARDAGLERVFAAALARDEFDVATAAARELPTERSQELISELVNVAAEHGEFGQAINAAASLDEGPATATIAELVRNAIAQGYSLEEIWEMRLDEGGAYFLDIVLKENPSLGHPGE